jgi:hypothetical protein
VQATEDFLTPWLSLHFLLISALHFVPVAFDWTTHEVPFVMNPSVETDHNRWEEFISFVSVTFFIAGIYTFSEISLPFPLQTIWPYVR